jgi:hypothetical protein
VQQSRDSTHSAPQAGSPPAAAAESGQVLLDRARHADVLEALWLLNAHAEVTYECIVGDKDTFWLAFQLAGKGAHFWQVGLAARGMRQRRWCW